MGAQRKALINDIVLEIRKDSVKKDAADEWRKVTH
jgi:hypothetical protein